MRTLLALAASTAALGHPPAQAHARAVLVRVTPGRAAAALVRASGGIVVARPLGIWRVPGRKAPRLLERLRVAGVLRSSEPDGTLEPLARVDAGDPLLGTEWWLRSVGADALEPPGPGRSVTVVDSGLDLSHPEFASRPDTTAANRQTTAGEEENHGTMVSSVLAAPANGVGLVGIYPRAVLRSWDISPSGFIVRSQAVRGIVDAADHGPGVISLSFGSHEDDSLIRNAVMYAVRKGSLVVAAAGNDRRVGSPASFPASLPHVLTVGATDEGDRPARFSSESTHLDLAAPGQAIPVADTLADAPDGYAVASGTSFSAPIVAGAAAWVWTVRPELDASQLFELLRRSAVDVDPRGWDPQTGFGLLSLPRALAATAAARDPEEPNDELDQVRPRGLFAEGTPPLTTQALPAGSIHAAVDARDDSIDVFRVYAPPRRAITVTLAGDADVNLSLYGPRAATLATPVRSSRRPGLAADTVRFTNRNRNGEFVYVSVRPAAAVAAAGYDLTVATVARR